MIKTGIIGTVTQSIFNVIEDLPISNPLIGLGLNEWAASLVKNSKLQELARLFYKTIVVSTGTMALWALSQNHQESKASLTLFVFTLIEVLVLKKKNRAIRADFKQLKENQTGRGNPQEIKSEKIEDLKEIPVRVENSTAIELRLKNLEEKLLTLNPIRSIQVGASSELLPDFKILVKKQGTINEIEIVKSKFPLFPPDLIDLESLEIDLDKITEIDLSHISFQNFMNICWGKSKIVYSTFNTWLNCLCIAKYLQHETTTNWIEENFPITSENINHIIEFFKKSSINSPRLKERLVSELFHKSLVNQLGSLQQLFLEKNLIYLKHIKLKNMSKLQGKSELFKKITELEVFDLSEFNEITEELKNIMEICANNKDPTIVKFIINNEHINSMNGMLWDVKEFNLIIDSDLNDTDQIKKIGENIEKLSKKITLYCEFKLINNTLLSVFLSNIQNAKLKGLFLDCSELESFESKQFLELPSKMKSLKNLTVKVSTNSDTEKMKKSFNGLSNPNCNIEFIRRGDF